ncbi:MAG: rod shape-determining protein MreC [Candidatus Eremiobacteraeota bacterium]|nr:rod shape-determining protein MreC [Candidatus Eremiobacteraeota bacterium]
MIVTALIALVQLDAAKSGKPSIFAIAASASAYYLQDALAASSGALRNAGSGLADAPRLYAENGALRERNRTLVADNARLSEALARVPESVAIEREREREGTGIVASTIGYDPENVFRQITIDRGSDAGIRPDDGVVNEDGVVGRVVAVLPFESTVLLVTDGASKVPAVVQRGRWWGIATGTSGRIRLQYVSQDAKLKVGDVVVTGEGRSFHAGLPIGRITRVDHPEGALYQSAVVEPAVQFGRLSRVLTLPQPGAAGAAPAR